MYVLMNTYIIIVYKHVSVDMHVLYYTLRGCRTSSSWVRGAGHRKPMYYITIRIKYTCSHIIRHIVLKQ